MPEFKGGTKAFYDYVGKNYSFPAEARKNNVQGRLILSFFVETDGSLSDIRVLRDLGYGTGKAAVELLRKSPAWTPGMNKGKPVRVAYTLPIQLNQEKGKAESLRAPSLSIGRRSDGMSDLERAYIIVDGQEKSYDDIKQIDPATIGSINVLKGKEATEQYGDKGNNGVVIIKTRK